MRNHFEYIHRSDYRPDEEATRISISGLLWMVIEGVALFAIAGALIVFVVGIGTLGN